MLGQDRDRDRAACWPRDQTEIEHLVYRDETERQDPKSRFAQLGLKCSGILGSLAAATHMLSLYVCYNFNSTRELSFVSFASPMDISFGNYVRLFEFANNVVRIFDAQLSQIMRSHPMTPVISPIIMRWRPATPAPSHLRFLRCGG